MATITNAEVEALLEDYAGWFGPHDDVTGVTDGVTEDDADFTFDTAGDVEITINFLELSDPVTAKQIIIGAVVDDLGDNYDSITASGPLTRVTADSLMPGTVKDKPRIEFTDADGDTVFMTYTQLATSPGTFVGLAKSTSDVTADIISDLASLKSLTDAMTAPYTDANYKTVVDALHAIVVTRGLW